MVEYWVVPEGCERGYGSNSDLSCWVLDQSSLLSVFVMHISFNVMLCRCKASLDLLETLPSEERQQGCKQTQ